MKDGMICNCKQVSYADVENALHQMTSFTDVLSAFEDVQKITHCSTGCGGCHDKILDAISEIMMKQRRRKGKVFQRMKAFLFCGYRKGQADPYAGINQPAPYSMAELVPNVTDLLRKCIDKQSGCDIL